MSLPNGARREMLALSGAAAGASSLGIAAASFAQVQAEPARLLLSDRSVKGFGAKGDGVLDDTAAIQSAIDQAIHAGGGLVYIPAGEYRITRSLLVKSTRRIDIVGDGASSILLHENDEPLLLWKKGVECLESSVRNLCITSVGQPKSPGTPSIQCQGSIRRSLFADLLILSGGVATGTGIELIGATNTIHLDRCVIWDVPAGGSGIKVGNGCEVRIFGGRLVAERHPDGGLATGSIGLNLVGGNGGVHVVTTDFSLFDIALKAGAVDGEHNRELFITHATFDAGRIGIHILNTAYVSISGCWCVSSDEAQIMMEGKCQAIVPSSGPLLTLLEDPSPMAEFPTGPAEVMEFVFAQGPSRSRA